MEIFMTYILPVIIFMAIGAAAGGLMVLATKFLAVKEDETVAKIAEVLPNANCGACGFAGCADYAKAVAAGTAPSNKCKPGGSDVAAKGAAIMGTGALETVKEVACGKASAICATGGAAVTARNLVASSKSPAAAAPITIKINTGRI